MSRYTMTQQDARDIARCLGLRWKDLDDADAARMEDLATNGYMLWMRHKSERVKLTARGAAQWKALL